MRKISLCVLISAINFNIVSAAIDDHGVLSISKSDAYKMQLEKRSLNHLTKLTKNLESKNFLLKFNCSKNSKREVQECLPFAVEGNYVASAKSDK